jgi:hypothetical protein
VIREALPEATIIKDSEPPRPESGRDRSSGSANSRVSSPAEGGPGI